MNEVLAILTSLDRQTSKIDIESNAIDSHSISKQIPIQTPYTSLFMFPDAALQKKYDEYRQGRISYIALIPLLVFLSLYYIYLSININLATINHPMYVYVRVFATLRIFLLCPGWILVLRHFTVNPILRNIPATHFGNAFVISHALCAGIVMVLRCFIGECTSDYALHQYGCNPEFVVNRLPQDIAFTILIMLAILQSIVKCHHWPATLIAWIISVLSFIIAIAAAPVTASFLVLVVLLLAFAQLYDSETTSMISFLSIINLEATVRQSLQVENEKHLADMNTAELRSLFGNVAHDLKTPLQAFVCELETLDSQLRINEENRKELKTVKTLRDTCQFMYMTINRAIDFNKASAGIPLAPAQETLNLMNTLHWAIDVVNRSQPRIPITLEPLPKDVCPDIITDKQWLIENVLCLGSNAVKYTSVTVRAFVSKASVYGGSSSMAMLCVEVEDSGIGVPASSRGSLFQPFKSMQRMAGTGLGLYSMSKRVESLGGKCGLQDRWDKAPGSCFWFSVPYRPDEVSSRSVSYQSRSSMSRSRSCEPEQVTEMSNVDTIILPSSNEILENEAPTVLFVEDSLMVQKTTARALKAYGFAVVVAENGAIALDMMQKRVYSLVLMDLQMPVMDGLEAVRRLRQWETNTERCTCQVIIGVSANSDIQTQQEALSVGMNGFIAKPFSVKQLVSFCRNEGIDIEVQR